MKENSLKNRFLQYVSKDIRHMDQDAMVIMLVVLGILTLFMGERQLSQQEYSYGIVSMVFGIAMELLALWYRFWRNELWLTIGSGALFFTLMLYFICLGGIRIDYLYLFPIVAIYCYGHFFGGISSILLVATLGVVYLSPLHVHTEACSVDHTAYFPVVYTVDFFISMILVSKVNRYEDEREEMLQKAQQANEAKSAFLANMSHEIRTPMNSILGLCELTMEEELSDIVRDNCNNIHVAGHNLLRIINDLLDFSKIESGRMELKPEEYSLSSLLNDVVQMTMARKGNKPIEFLVDCDPNIPNRLYGDELRIRQIVINLLTNAIKFTRKGGVCFKISGRKESYGINLMFQVIDSGIGIKEENIDDIFRNFTQVDTKKNREIEGTGMGLAISQRLAKKMGGFLFVDSSYGKGSTFTFVVPQKVVEEKPMVVMDANHPYRVVTYHNFCEIYEPFVVNHYAKIIENTSKGLNVPMDAATSFSDLRNKIDTGEYTHLFLSEDYYEENKVYFDAVAQKIEVVLFQNERRTERHAPGIVSLCKPYYVLPICNTLLGQKLRFDGSRFGRHKRFIAPEASLLIVDDNQMNLRVAEGLLKPYQVELVTADNGLDAIELLQSREFDIVFMDHMMPGMDGVETLQRIREIDSDFCKRVPVVALTANAVNEAETMFIKAGFCDMVAKPVEMRMLETVLLRYIPRNKIHHEEESNE